MQFRIKVPLVEVSEKIDYSQKILFLGSCFSENIAEKLSFTKFQVVCNPFGIIYNPISICVLMNRAVDEEWFQEEELLENDRGWCSYLSHSDICAATAKEAASNLNASLVEMKKALRCAERLFFTMGSAWVYELKTTGDIVANCHKQPNSLFSKRLLGVQEVVDFFHRTIEKVEKWRGSSIAVVLTVSPVRHVRDGVHENNLSKSILHVAVNQLESGGVVSYFPAYELVVDDLRDYRFFANDLVHPSEVAIDYVWDFFQKTFFEAGLQEFVKKVEKMQKEKSHRFMTFDRKKIQAFKDRWNIKWEALCLEEAELPSDSFL